MQTLPIITCLLKLKYNPNDSCVVWNKVLNAHFDLTKKGNEKERIVERYNEHLSSNEAKENSARARERERKTESKEKKK